MIFSVKENVLFVDELKSYTCKEGEDEIFLKTLKLLNVWELIQPQQF